MPNSKQLDTTRKKRAYEGHCWRFAQLESNREIGTKSPKTNTARSKMTTSAVPQTQGPSEEPGRKRATVPFVRRVVRVPVAREILIVLAFGLFTAALTWPYVTRLRDAVVDTGDPYLVAWILWWDYHQTFTDPLRLFHANTFYPLKYTLAFSEHSYGIALLFFPLYALGLKPLTVHAVALFMSFALTGYGAFRLGRTLTGSAGVGWVAGIIFAFVPYRFNLMSQVPYVFSPWIPLVFEALVLFVRERSKTRAAWLGCAFFMSGISTISWFTFTLVPFVLYTAILLTRYGLWRDRNFWRRGGVALATAALAMLPFMLPYLLASRLYGFKRSIDEIKAQSAWPIHWLSVENRNKLWNRMGESITEGWKFKLFPGLLPILFSTAALTLGGRTLQTTGRTTLRYSGLPQERWVSRIDILITILFALSILSIGFDRMDSFYGLFDNITSERALALLTTAVVARLCLAYPRFLHTARANLVETLRSEHRGDAFWLGGLLTIIGFCFSLGWNFFLFRISYQLIPMFKSMRVVSRGAMLAYLGLALLSGLGVMALTQRSRAPFPWVRAGVIYSVACALLLFELSAAPLRFERGEVYPDAVTLRLKQTPMRGGIVVLPAGGDFNHRYMLRAADHQKPLIVGTSGFNSPIEEEIENLTRTGSIQMRLLDLFESVPASYIVVENKSIAPERKGDFQDFLGRGVVSGRLRFINRFDGGADLYAVVKTEPEARSEAALSIDLSVRDWAAKLADDPVSLLGQPVEWSKQLYRIYVASSGAMPRYHDYISDLQTIGRGVVLDSESRDQQFEDNLRHLLADWTNREAFTKMFGGLDNAQYVDRLVDNAGISIDPAERAAMVAELSNAQETRSTVLLKIVQHPGFIEKEKYRSFLLLHYFGYLRRNPDDPPDRDLSGFNFWLRSSDPARLSLAFRESPEYYDFKRPGALGAGMKPN